MTTRMAVCILTVSISLTTLITLSGACPEKCTCTDPMSVTCNGVDAFPKPEDLPEGTAQIEIMNSNLPAIANLPNYGETLENLLVINSGVTDIQDGAFSNFTGLKNLMLNGNKIKIITDATFSGLQQLVKLEMENNLIEAFPKGILSALPSLLNLDLSSNKNLQLDADAFDGSNLVNLDIGRCGLGMVNPAIFSKASGLKWLNLDHNPLRQLGKDSFKDMENLKELFLSDCDLTEVHEDAFDDLKSLESLDLSFNQLTELDKDILDDMEDSLKTLRLQHNNLTMLDHEFMGVESLTVGDNPWQCDCELLWMKEVSATDEDTPAVCATPEQYHGALVSNATAMLDCPCGYEGCEGNEKLALYIAIPVIILLVLLLGFFVFMIVRNRKEKAKRKSVKYSAVYKDTVESASKPV